MNIFRRKYQWYEVGKKDPPKPTLVQQATAKAKEVVDYLKTEPLIIDPKVKSYTEIAKMCNARTQYTPDYYYLEHLRYNHILVVDDMQEYHPLHNVLKQPDVLHFGPAFTRDRYTMAKVCNEDRSYPIPIQTEKAWMQMGVKRYPYVPIRGELYCVPATVICDIDRLRCNGGVVQRERVGILYPHTVIRRFKGSNAWYPEKCQSWTDTAWLYVGDPKYWNRTIDDGYNFGPVRTYSPTPCLHKGLETFYHWTQKEYE